MNRENVNNIARFFIFQIQLFQIKKDRAYRNPFSMLGEIQKEPVFNEGRVGES